jgi:hypothetical protein
MKRDQLYNVIRCSVIPYTLILIVTLQKLRLVRVEEIPESNKPRIITSIETVERLIKEVLSGGYNVHPKPQLNSLTILNMTRV